ncbi:hypothetical protein EVAR_26662_1 [Eumeta japonica]|uniref:Serpin domain-containing protein n=1 Tax=Eumeta variegata TaxID=151549 RepID=A0A4C1VM45_EUMVA|nr:hypothetical protein EVAR_26662_1 [Eumeta japonica]
MRAPERVYTVAVAFLACVSNVAAHTGPAYQYANGVWSPYGIPVEAQLWGKYAKPLEQMVDVVNEFGLKVLAEHNFLNDNNIAFSPYGLTGIMVALYEGVDGESSYEIQRSMQLPWERKAMRIGFRDIHRTLKTYFVPESGFLAGLALSNENVTFKDTYKNVLRFYGFDLSNDQLPTLPPKNDTTAKDDDHTSTDQNPTTVNPIESTEENKKGEETSSTTPPPEDNGSPGTEETTTIGVDIRQPITMPGPSSAPNSENAATTALQPTEFITNSPDVTASPTTETENSPSTTTTVASVDDMTSTSNALISTTMTETQTTSALDEPTINNEVEIITQTPTAESLSTDMGSTTITMTENTSMADTETPISGITATENTMATDAGSVAETMPTMGQITTLAETVPPLNESNLETLERKKKSIVDFIYTNPSYIDDYGYYGTMNLDTEYAEQYRNDLFLANGVKSVQVTFMYYETILEHAFLPHLQASALRLPLDSPRYYLLVILPTRSGNREVSLLLARLARESDLRDVYGALRPRRVRAVVPSFTVKGHVSLTTDLQKLGIRNVFEPRQRDFGPMTDQVGVYVRSVEQAVSVTIRKYKARAYYQNDTRGRRLGRGSPEPPPTGYVTHRRTHRRILG